MKGEMVLCPICGSACAPAALASCIFCGRTGCPRCVDEEHCPDCEDKR